MHRWFVSLLTLGLCVAFLIESFDIRRMPGADPAGPAFYPRVVIALTAAAALAVLWRSVSLAGLRMPEVRLPSARGFLTPSDDDAPATVALRVAAAMGLTVLYPLAILKIGFVLATTAFTIALMALFAVRPVLSVLLGLIVSVALHFFFTDLLGARVIPGEWIDPMRAIGF